MLKIYNTSLWSKLRIPSLSIIIKHNCSNRVLLLLNFVISYINKKNYEDFSIEYFEKFNQYPNQLSFLSYDLVGLVYYLILQNNSIVDEKMFTKKTLFKGKVGIFEIKNNKINHILNFYKAEDGKFKKVF